MFGAFLAGSAVGLLASTLGRLYSSTYYALRDTRTPLRFAVIRVALTTALVAFAPCGCRGGWALDPAGAWGADGVRGVAGWVEFTLLRHALNRRIGRTGCQPDWSRAYGHRRESAAAAAWAIKLALGPTTAVGGIGGSVSYGAIYSP